MSGALGRAAALIVAPAPPAAATLPPACRAAVLGGVADVAPLAAALALTLRAADGSPTALVALWGAPTPRRAAASPAAGRLAAAVTTGVVTARGRLAAGVPPITTGAATARGRLVWLALPDDPDAAQAAVRAAAAVVAGPLVTALAGPRPPALDDLVAGHDLALVAAQSGTALARAAVARLAERGIPATACPPLRRGAAAALAVAGWSAPRLDLDLGARHGERAR